MQVLLNLVSLGRAAYLDFVDESYGLTKNSLSK